VRNICEIIIFHVKRFTKLIGGILTFGFTKEELKASEIRENTAVMRRVWWGHWEDARGNW
jgi:hypothetical protein